MSEKGKVFFGGLPTDLDVKKVVDAVGLPTTGQLVTYEQLEEILGPKKNNGRFYSVVNAWRGMLRREHNLISEGIRDQGILFLDPSRRIDHVRRKTAQAGRAIRRGYLVAAATDREDLKTEEIRKLDHVLALTGALLQLGHRDGGWGVALPAKKDGKE